MNAANRRICLEAVRDFRPCLQHPMIRPSSSGFNDGVANHIWANREAHEGRIVKYKSFEVGVKDKPRHPVFLGFRDVRDMS